MAQFAGEFPKATLDEALTHLRRPFTEGAVRFKIQSAFTNDPKGALIVTYIDARLVAERLNHVVGAAWSEDFDQPLGEAKFLTCRLTVLGVTRQDVGEATGGIALQKALRSDALKRAAVKFGIGASIYATPIMSLKPNDGLRPIKVYNPQSKRKDKDSFALNDKGQETCRKRYSKWLQDAGIAVFGEPLDHGDLVGSQGDVEVEEAAAAEEEVRQEQAVEGDDRALSAAELERIRQRLKEAELNDEQELMLFGLVGVESLEELTYRTAFSLVSELATMKPEKVKPPKRGAGK